MIKIPLKLTLYLNLDADGFDVDEKTVSKRANIAILEALSDVENLSDYISDGTGWLVSGYIIEDGWK